MQIELEILKLQTKVPVQKVQKTTQTHNEPRTQSKQDDHSSLVKKYIELATEHSIRNADNVLIEDLHSGYESWHSKEYPNGSSVSKTIFISIVGKFTEYTKKRIPIGPRVNNVTPRKIGIVNRKFKTWKGH